MLLLTAYDERKQIEGQRITAASIADRLAHPQSPRNPDFSRTGRSGFSFGSSRIRAFLARLARTCDDDLSKVTDLPDGLAQS